MGRTELRLSVIMYKEVFTEAREYQQYGQEGSDCGIKNLMCEHVNLFVTELNRISSSGQWERVKIVKN